MSAVVSMTCFHCRGQANGTVADGKGHSTTVGTQSQLAGPVCSSCGIFVCTLHREPACKAAGVKAKDCPSCKARKAWTRVLTSPSPAPHTTAPTACTGCGKELSGRVVTIAQLNELTGPAKVPSATVCYNCGVAYCTKWRCTKAPLDACSGCDTVSSFTGRLVAPQAVAKDVKDAFRRLENESGWVDYERGRAKLEPLLHADAADLIALALPDGVGEPLQIARLVELGRSDLASDDVLSNLVERADSNSAAASALGRIALCLSESRVTDRVFDTLGAQNPGSRGVAVGYLALIKDERAVEALTSLLGDEGSVPYVSLDANAPPSELRRLGGWSSLGKVFNPAGIGGGPHTTVSKLAEAALKHIG